MGERPDVDDLPEEIREALPEFDDEYIDRVAHRLVHHYDIEKEYRLDGRCWDLYAEMRVISQKQLLHPALSYADHETEEFVFLRREPRPTVSTLEQLVEHGHEIADERIVADEEHFETEISFVLLAEELSEDVREFVSGFRDRTLLRFGYYGHYEINLVVVVPDEQTAVASTVADIADGVTLWETERDDDGVLSRVVRRLRK